MKEFIQVRVYNTTLKDVFQAEGISFSKNYKIRRNLNKTEKDSNFYDNWNVRLRK